MCCEVYGRWDAHCIKLVPAMANNVLVVLLTQLLLGIGYILARVF